MSQHKIGNISVNLLRFQPQLMHILYQDLRRPAVGKKAPVLLCPDRLSVADVVMSYNQDIVLVEIPGEGAVPFDILCHTMRDLQDGPDLSRIRNVPHRMDGRMPVS